MEGDLTMIASEKKVEICSHFATPSGENLLARDPALF